MRSMADPNYKRRTMTAAEREKRGEVMRAALGNPDGLALVYGIFVPVAHAKPLRYWAEYIARTGRDCAVEFVQNVKASNYSAMPEINRLWQIKMDAREVNKILKTIQREIRHEN